eukprot:853453-Pelagomonas_calceolata.AAC.2
MLAKHARRGIAGGESQHIHLKLGCNSAHTMACKGNTSSAPIVAIQRVTADMLKPFASILAIRAEQAHLPWYASSYHYPCSVWSGAA